MSLSNIFGWSKKDEQPAGAACGTACGAAGKPEEKPAACGSACGAGEPEKNRQRVGQHAERQISRVHKLLEHV